MATQKTFTDSYASSLNEKVSRGEDLQLYLNKDFVFDESQTQWVGGLVQPEGLLDNMLNYSGLLMSGANYRLKGHQLPNELEDGILTETYLG